MIAYSIFRLFETVFLALPDSLQKAFILGIAKVAYMVDTKHKNIIKANLDLTMGKKISVQKYQDIVKYCHKNLALVLLQVLRSSKMSVEKMQEIVSFENRHFVDEALKDGKPIIFISAHYGNWELGATAISALVHRTTSIHKKMNDSYFDDYLLKSRTKFNMTMVEKKGAIKHLVRALKKGDSISMMVDQNVNPKDGVYVDFLGAKATQTAAPAFLARKFDALIVPVLIYVSPENENIISFFEPIVTEKTDNEEKDIFNSTQAQADVLSKVITSHPEPWFWCHKRWKSAHEEIYK